MTHHDCYLNSKVRAQKHALIIYQVSSFQDNIELFNRAVQAQEQKFVLAIDCLENLSADSDHAHVLEDFTWLPNTIPDTCRIIITCTTNAPMYHNFTENYNSKVSILY